MKHILISSELVGRVDTDKFLETVEEKQTLKNIVRIEKKYATIFIDHYGNTIMQDYCYDAIELNNTLINFHNPIKFNFKKFYWDSNLKSNIITIQINDNIFWEALYEDKK